MNWCGESRILTITNETMELAAKVTEKFTQEIKFSGYSRVEIKEVIVSGLLGWKRKIKRRADAKEAFYRSARSTLPGRCKKKLTEKTNWCKRSKRLGEDEQVEKGKKGREDQVSSREEWRKEKIGGSRRRRIK